VTRNGVAVDSASHKDLWDGIRVAGSSLGIVTGFKLQLFAEPEPKTFEYRLTLTEEESYDLLFAGGDDPRITVNYYVLDQPWPAQTALYQFAWSDTSDKPTDEQAQTKIDAWLTEHFESTYSHECVDASDCKWSSWKTTVRDNFNNTLGIQLTAPNPAPEPIIGDAGHTVGADAGAYYPETWVTSSLSIPRLETSRLPLGMSSVGFGLEAKDVARWLMERFKSHDRGNVTLPGLAFPLAKCWLFFNCVGNYLYYDLSCWQAVEKQEFIQSVERDIHVKFPDMRWEKYANVPTSYATEAEDRAVAPRMYGDYGALQGVKQRYDPTGRLNQFQGIRNSEL